MLPVLTFRLMPRLHLTVLTTRNEPDVCENRFSSFKTQISCLQYEASFLYSLHKQNVARAWQQENTFLQAFRSVPGCQICMCKRGMK